MLMKQIVSARSTGKPICEHSAKEAKARVSVLFLKISAISGADLPPNPTFAEILIEEFILFLNDFGYGEFTFDEIVLAFRLNAKGSGIYPKGSDCSPAELRGTYFNIDFAARILENYSQFRNLTDRKFQNFIDGYE